MKILTDADFVKIEDVKLNRGGKNIGQIVRLGTDFYYKSHRTDEHFFILYKGFGCDATLIMKLADRTFNSELQKRLHINRYIKGIIIEYQGKKEHRLYFADLDTWFLEGNVYSTAKQTDKEVQSYGRQRILPVSKMSIIGYFQDDCDVLEAKKSGLLRYSR